MMKRDTEIENRLQIDMAKLAYLLAFHRFHLYDLAAHIQVAPSSLSGWLRGRRVAPGDLRTRLESALGVSPGYLVPSAPIAVSNSDGAGR